MDQSPRDIWGKALAELSRELTPIGYEVWISKLLPDTIDGTSFVLLAPESTVKTTIEHRYLKKIQSALFNATGLNYDVRLILNSQSRDADSSQAGMMQKDTFPSNLKFKYTFNTFVKGKSNELAFAASMAVAESPGQTTYNPLFLYGGVGLGKTHLMHSIGNYILDVDPYMKVLYTSSETLVNDFVTSVRKETMPQFREKYRNVDVLLVDDIQFIIGKEQTQEEFFHTFNTLFFSNKQIVISSDKPPSELKPLEERLISRFGSGLVVDITLPEYETRIAILEKKAEAEQIPIPPEVLQYLARNISTNIRELEGSLNKVIALSKLTKVGISLELAEEAIKDMITGAEKREIDVPFIQDIVAEHFKVTAEEIRSKKRTANLSHARHVAMYLTRKILDLPLTSIGKFFGGRDHSTVVHAIDKISEEIEMNDEFENTIAELEKKVRAG